MSRRNRWIVPAGLLLVVSAAPEAARAQGIPQSRTCVGCHLQLDEERLVLPARDFENDIHHEAGFTCLDCHGPPSDGPPRPAAGFLSSPSRQDMAAMCSRCHADAAFMRGFNPSLRVDQAAEYATSVHGRLLQEENDPNVAVCSSCHPAHNIRPPSDAQSSVHPLRVAETCSQCHGDPDLMSQYGLPSDQQEEYEQSVHWRWMTEEEDLSAPTCNDCHGNHGAAPPGVSSVRNVCGQCHSVMADQFRDGRHAQVFTDAGLPGCATCHGNHQITHPTDEQLYVYGDSVCGMCHDAGEPGYDDFRQIRGLIDSLIGALTASEAILEEAENLGMEVTQAQFTMEEGVTALVKARAAIHAFSVDTVRQVVAEGLETAGRAHARGEEALAEHLFRRQGLAVSVVLILLLVIGLAAKIRQIERGPSPTGTTPPSA